MVSTKYMDSIIISGLDLIDEYKKKDVYTAIISAMFREEFPDYYLSYQYGNFEVSSVNFKIADSYTYEEIVKSFEKHIASTFGNADDAKIKNALGYATKDFRYEGNGEFYMYSTAGMRNYDSLFMILDYAVNDVISKDRKRVLDLMRNHRIDSFTIAFKESFPELDDLLIVAQKNGKVKLKGLDDNELNKIQYVFDISK